MFELGALLRRLSLLDQERLEAGGEMVGPVSFGVGADPFTVRPLSFGVDPFPLVDDERVGLKTSSRRVAR